MAKGLADNFMDETFGDAAERIMADPDEVVLHDDLQHRVGDYDDTVRDYANNMHVADDKVVDGSGEVWPACQAVRTDEGKVIVYNGFLRTKAARLSGVEQFPYDIVDGDRREAWKRAKSANYAQGERRTREDKQNAVKAALRDDEVRQWTDSRIADLCKVSRTMVRNWREKLEEAEGIEQPSSRKTKTGGTQDTSNIGSRKQSADVTVERSPESSVTEGVYKRTDDGKITPIADYRKNKGGADEDDPSSDLNLKVRCADFREHLPRLDDGSVDVIVTRGIDSTNNLWAWKALAEEADRLLADRGIAALWVPPRGRLNHPLLAEVMAIFGATDLEYYWQVAVYWSTYEHQRGPGVDSRHTPILLFGNGDQFEHLDDCITNVPRTNEGYEFAGKSLASSLAKEQCRVVDPMASSGELIRGFAMEGHECLAIDKDKGKTNEIQ